MNNKCSDLDWKGFVCIALGTIVGFLMIEPTKNMPGGGYFSLLLYTIIGYIGAGYFWNKNE